MVCCAPAVLGHGSATVGPGPQRPGTAGFGGNNMFASAGDSPGMHLQALQGNNQRRPGTASNMFGTAGGGNRLGAGGVGGTNGMRMGLPRSNIGESCASFNCQGRFFPVQCLTSGVMAHGTPGSQSVSAAGPADDQPSGMNAQQLLLVQ